MTEDKKVVLEHTILEFPRLLPILYTVQKHLIWEGTSVV
jgi:hypothetical protein